LLHTTIISQTPRIGGIQQWALNDVKIYRGKCS